MIFLKHLQPTTLVEFSEVSLMKKTNRYFKNVVVANMNNIINEITKIDCHKWNIEQTKEARFMPSLVQDRV